MATSGFLTHFFCKVVSICGFVLRKRVCAPSRPMGRRWWGKESVQRLSSEETPASIAELSAPVSTASGKKLALSPPSNSGTSEASRKLPTKDQIYPPY